MPTTNAVYSTGQVHYDRPLTSLAVNYLLARAGTEDETFIAHRVFPTVNVRNRSDVYYVVPDNGLDGHVRPRAPGTESDGSILQVSNSPYYCGIYARHCDVPDPVRANADSILMLDKAASMNAFRNCLLGREKEFAARYILGSPWTFKVEGDTAATPAGSFDPTSPSDNRVLYWDDDNSTPIEDMSYARRKVTEENGARFDPNVLVLTRDVYDALRLHPDIIGRLNRGQTTGPAKANKDDLARLFEVDRIEIMNAVQKSGNVTSTEVGGGTFVATKTALLAYAADAPSLMDPSAGYTFAWTGYTGRANMGIRVKKFRIEPKEVDRIEASMAYDMKVVGASLAYQFANIIQN